MCALFKTLLLAAAVLTGNSGMACKRIMFARLSFAADSAEIDPSKSCSSQNLSIARTRPMPTTSAFPSTEALA